MECAKIYADYLKKFLKLEANLRCVCDSSNGTVGSVLRRLKSNKLFIDLINSSPDGKFPAHGPDPWAGGAMTDIISRVKKIKADFGAIFDADGDRVFFVDDRGRLVPQEAVALLLARDFPSPYLIDLRMGWLVKKSPLKFIESRVGHYFIKRTMKAKNIKLGVEFSGHIYFENKFGRNKSYFDSGIRAMVHFANAVGELNLAGQKLSSWLDSLPAYYRIKETNFVVKNKRGTVKTIENIYRRRTNRVSHLDGLTMEFQDWWFNIRESNTEPLLRLNIEAKTPKIVSVEFKKLSGLIK
ncbi:MAG: hypothetical protein KGJ89_00960 [Patescibacteria group bacterium]|nr:hypothetical protein [Patescibacteria group bacterium]MDE2015083.1 hypothetical protein [Patescibacteria group bacterium]MDE2226511.1 hypothetical protein [Patescibacteria group bacterium]